MNRILNIIGFLVAVVTLFMVIFSNSLNASFTPDTAQTIWMVWSLLLALLVLGLIITARTSTAVIRKDYSRLELENRDLKAKLYDDIVKETGKDETIVIKTVPTGNRPTM